MEKERYNYIVLDSNSGGGAVDENIVQCDANTWTATWNMYDYLFSEYEHGDDVYIELVSASFIAQPTTGFNATYYEPTKAHTTVNMSNVYVKNQKSTNTTQVLGILPSHITTSTGGEYHVSPTNEFQSPMKLKVDKFNKISLSVFYEVNNLNIADGDENYRFILKVSYQKNN
jgi:hypothetical protein